MSVLSCRDKDSYDPMVWAVMRWWRIDCVVRMWPGDLWAGAVDCHALVTYWLCCQDVTRRRMSRSCGLTCVGDVLIVLSGCDQATYEPELWAVMRWWRIDCVVRMWPGDLWAGAVDCHALVTYWLCCQDVTRRPMNRSCGLSCVGDVLIVLSGCDQATYEPELWAVMRWWRIDCVVRMWPGDVWAGAVGCHALVTYWLCCQDVTRRRMSRSFGLSCVGDVLIVLSGCDQATYEPELWTVMRWWRIGVVRMWPGDLWAGAVDCHALVTYWLCCQDVTRRPMNRSCGLSCVGDVLIVLSGCDQATYEPELWAVMRWWRIDCVVRMWPGDVWAGAVGCHALVTYWLCCQDVTRRRMSRSFGLSCVGDVLIVLSGCDQATYEPELWTVMRWWRIVLSGCDQATYEPELWTVMRWWRIGVVRMWPGDVWAGAVDCHALVTYWLCCQDVTRRPMSRSCGLSCVGDVLIVLSGCDQATYEPELWAVMRCWHIDCVVRMWPGDLWAGAVDCHELVTYWLCCQDVTRRRMSRSCGLSCVGDVLIVLSGCDQATYEPELWTVMRWWRIDCVVRMWPGDLWAGAVGCHALVTYWLCCQDVTRRPMSRSCGLLCVGDVLIVLSGCDQATYEPELWTVMRWWRIDCVVRMWPGDVWAGAVGCHALVTYWLCCQDVTRRRMSRSCGLSCVGDVLIVLSGCDQATYEPELWAVMRWWRIDCVVRMWPGDVWAGAVGCHALVTYWLCCQDVTRRRMSRSCGLSCVGDVLIVLSGCDQATYEPELWAVMRWWRIDCVVRMWPGDVWAGAVDCHALVTYWLCCQDVTRRRMSRSCGLSCVGDVLIVLSGCDQATYEPELWTVMRWWRIDCVVRMWPGDVWAGAVGCHALVTYWLCCQDVTRRRMSRSCGLSCVGDVLIVLSGCDQATYEPELWAVMRWWRIDCVVRMWPGDVWAGAVDCHALVTYWLCCQDVTRRRMSRSFGLSCVGDVLIVLSGCDQATYEPELWTVMRWWRIDCVVRMWPGDVWAGALGCHALVTYWLCCQDVTRRRMSRSCGLSCVGDVLIVLSGCDQATYEPELWAVMRWWRIDCVVRMWPGDVWAGAVGWHALVTYWLCCQDVTRRRMSRSCGLSCVGDVLIVLSGCDQATYEPELWAVMRWWRIDCVVRMWPGDIWAGAVGVLQQSAVDEGDSLWRMLRRSTPWHQKVDLLRRKDSPFNWQKRMQRYWGRFTWVMTCCLVGRYRQFYVGVYSNDITRH